MTLEKNIIKADHIFIAKVESVDGERPEETTLHLKDVYSLIGTGGKTIIIDNRNCPMKFEKNHHYKFFAKEENGLLKTNLCMGTAGESTFYPRELCLIDQRRGLTHDCGQL